MTDSTVIVIEDSDEDETVGAGSGASSTALEHAHSSTTRDAGHKRPRDEGQPNMYADVRIEPKSAKLKARLFVDLDGVLADFEHGVQKLTGRLPDQLPPATMWAKLQAAKPGFFTTLRWTQDCGEHLWQALSPLNPQILTGLPRGNWAEGQKRDWCRQKLGASVIVHCCMSKKKKEFAERW